MTKKHDEIPPLPPEGLWISPEGKAIPVIEHLLAIQHYPHVFGFTKRDVSGRRIDHLRDLAEKMIRDGWTRFRFLNNTWAFEVGDIKSRIGYIEGVLAKSGAQPHEGILISQVKQHREWEGTVEKFFDRTLFRNFEVNPNRNRWRFS